MARSPAPASMARAAFSGDLKERTEIIDIICKHNVNKYSGHGYNL